jgi:hypothetical protein
MTIAAQKHAEIVEPGDIALQFHAVDQIDGDCGFAFADRVQERVLKVLRLIVHG